MRCHGSYMSLFDACVLAIARFNSEQMSVLLGKPDCAHADQLLQPSSLFSIRLYVTYYVL